MAPAQYLRASAVLLAVLFVNAQDNDTCTGPAMCTPTLQQFDILTENPECSCTVSPADADEPLTLEACCVTDETASSDSCREIQLVASQYSREATVDTVAVDATLSIPVTFSTTDAASSSCTRTCSMYGDPEGISFCGDIREFILCDGRIDDVDSDDVCQQSKSVCESRTDYYGNQCVYLPDQEGSTWSDFDTDGSPCQMDPSAEAPVQVMYSRAPLSGSGDSYAVSATIGERGIMTSITIEYNGVSSTLSSDDCIANPGETSAWSNADNIADYGTAQVNGGGAQVVWDFSIADMDLHLVCQQMSETRTRWDVDSLSVSTSAAEAASTLTETGFCVTSEFNTGEATQTELFETGFHSYCLERATPNLLVCRTLSKECTRDVYEATVDEFCESAKGQMGISVSKCKKQIKKQIKREVKNRSSKDIWAKLYCHVVENGSNSGIKSCLKKIDDFGFVEVYSETSSMLATSSSSCDLSASLAVVTDEEDECFDGMHVEVVYDGTRTRVASVPASRLVCEEPLVLTGEDYPTLFVEDSDIYLVQCGLTESCAAQRGFRDVPAISIGSESSSSSYVTLSLGESSSTSTSDSAPSICESAESDTVESCPYCCELQDTPDSSICLDVTVSTSPYCDASNPPTDVDCSDVVAEDSDVYVDITLITTPAETTCCHTCTAWGDPKLYAFDGWDETPAEWIECDGRNPNSNCNFQESVCDKQVDHLGNACVWNETVSEYLENDRSAVGFYGSPCQPDWEAAAENGWRSNITMYETDSWMLRVFLGERSVLTTLEFELASGGYHEFDPAMCFEDDLSDAWTSYGDASSTPAGDGIEYECGDIDTNGLERPCAMTNSATSTFVQIRCIRVEMDDVYQGYRINIVGVSEFSQSGEYASVGGFCVDDSLEGPIGESTDNVDAGDECGLDMNDLGTQLSLGRLCKDIYHPTCTSNEADEAIRRWCKYQAVLPLEDKLSCAEDILGTSDDDAKEEAWRDYFCQQFPGEVRKCKKGYRAYLDTTPTATMCFSSVDEVAAFGHDPCMVGTSVTAASGDEILFIPDHIPPCDNVLRVPASNSSYAALFTSTVEFNKCGVQTAECPLYTALPEAFCRTVDPFSVQLTYSAGNLCGAA
ncbi:Hypothetical Protein FCC1311_068692 [Hondaea fermentalgiana]|uniref:Uncharacterized protein n=1 Tax=Hondaea fermentalgiana TaxID=2315210 RepID=A0A2R5GJZ9_9STRA|nr:Hypothetical Protein FCC1311_068692 [Hondaea fermentalgiana]|eukprot:GBG30649.1 Hypothetical Protein FCC1311_068692 [Hondaea fermentalgiana]